RIHLERRAAVCRPLPRDEVELIARAEEDAADGIAAPPLALETDVDRPLHLVTEPDGCGIRAVPEADPSRQLEQQLEPPAAAFRVERDVALHVVSLERPLALEVDGDVDAWLP